MSATMGLVTAEQVGEVTKGTIQSEEEVLISQFNMDNISNLPQPLLLDILSLLSTKDIVATSGVSKQWQPIWKLVPKLRYDDRNYEQKYETFLHFVEKSLVLHEAPSLVSLKLKLGPKCTADDIGLWILLAVDRKIQELNIRYGGHIRLPKRLCTCTTLVVLKLKNAILEDVSLSARFSVLKTLHLQYVKYSGDESLRNLLSSCPSLHNLVVKRHNRDNVKRFVIKARYLQSLKLYLSPLHDEADSDEYVISTPNLKYLEINDHCTRRCSFEAMPYLDEANLDVAFTKTAKFFESLTSVEKLSLCINMSKFRYPKRIIFSRLVHLELCTCDDAEWLNLVDRLLRDSPKLRSPQA